VCIRIYIGFPARFVSPRPQRPAPSVPRWLETNNASICGIDNWHNLPLFNVLVFGDRNENGHQRNWYFRGANVRCHFHYLTLLCLLFHSRNKGCTTMAEQARTALLGRLQGLHENGPSVHRPAVLQLVGL